MDNIEEVPIAFWQSPMYHFKGEYQHLGMVVAELVFPNALSYQSSGDLL